ncbi:MAG TPA: ribosome maturation factor RimP [Propionibacteriaceae bacterium]|nr:ribosome maturation factor RimP [Propionibacteriaceae bacterium]
MLSTDISTLLDPVVAAHDLEIDRIEITSAGKRSIVRIFLDGDGPDGHGPSLDQIAEATRSISASMDVSDVSRGKPYTLEVSSRGVTQPLTETKHFRRNTGRLITVVTPESEITGRIVSVTDDEVELQVGAASQPVVLAQITKATVQLELNRPIAGSDDDNEEA